MKHRAARIFLLLSIGSLLGAFIPGQAPGWLVMAAVFGISAAVCGQQWIRLARALFVVVSVICVILEIQRAKEFKALEQRRGQISQAKEAKTGEFRQKLQSISIADGVSKSEAEIIAESYFYAHVGCGSFTGIRDGGGFWIVDGFHGFSAVPIEDFRINKRSGQVRSSIGASYANPLQILR